MGDPSAPVRADRWLWAARFFKTRAQAVAAVTAGHVERDGSADQGEPADRPRGQAANHDRSATVHVVVLGTAQRRGSATDAAALYEETAESRAERERMAELRRLAAPPGADLGRRPTKRDRRQMQRARDRWTGPDT